MAARIQGLTPLQKDFEAAFRSLCTTASGWQVWNDFVDAAAITISNAVDPLESRREARESLFTAVMQRYGGGCTEAFSAMLGAVAQSLEVNQRQDFLGDLFMRLGLGSSWHGQYFTPYHVCEMMARMSVPDDLDDKEYTTVLDPACGAGATMIAARNVLHFDHHKGWEDVFFAGQDLSHTAGMMCYIQLSLLGCAGYVCVGDSLRNPLRSRTSLLCPDEADGQDIWYTPMYWMDPLQYRIFGELMKCGRRKDHRRDPAAGQAEERSDPEYSYSLFDLGKPGAAEEDPGRVGGTAASVHDQPG